MKDAVFVGQNFGKLTVVGSEEKPKLWICKCKCGSIVKHTSWQLVSGRVKSCGCSRGYYITKAKTRHGMANTKIYNVWASIKDRCLNPNCHEYKNYGDRGITMCDRWKSSFENFIADMGMPPHGYSLDRINNDKGYSLDNCRWATREAQNRNKRSNINISYLGKTMCLRDWCNALNMPYKTVEVRINSYDWDPIRAITTPIRKHKEYKRESKQ